MKKLTLVTGFIAFTGIGFAADYTPAINPDTAMALLEKGNAAFIDNPMSRSQAVREARASSIDSHTPIAVVVTCSDARTAPEHIFSKNLNRIFVVRTAGNVVDNIGLGSIEYAVKALGVRLIVVMGHQNCGAVKAAIAGGPIPPHISSIVNQIKPAVAIAKTEQGDLLSNSIEVNAIHVAAKIRHDSDLGDAAKDVKVVPAYYSLQTGKVHWLK